MDLANKKILILGLGESGLAMARWSAHCQAIVTVADTREAPDRLVHLRNEISNATFIGAPFDTLVLDGYDIIAVSPGLRPEVELKTVLPFAKAHNIPVWSEIELFAQSLDYLREKTGYQPKIIAVTGTNGKTTTTSLTGHMCRRAGKTVRLAGNISPAALDVLLECVTQNTLPDVWVLELSSFQLFTTYTLNPDASTVLNVTQDHLDWHGGMQAYADAKARIFGQTSVRVLNRDDDIVMKMASPKATNVSFGTDEPQNIGDFGLVEIDGLEWLATCSVATDSVPTARKSKVPQASKIDPLMPVDDLIIQGRHNASNALAALALCRAIGLPFAPLLQALREYKGEPHRVEFIQAINNITYIDDSKGTNVGATYAAIQGLGKGLAKRQSKIVLIAGGLGKDQDFSPLAPVVKAYVRCIMLIGRDANQIEQAMLPTGVDMHHCTTLEQAVKQGTELAQSGDTLLLSPACASMDMFRSYAHRSEVFVNTVHALANGE